MHDSSMLRMQWFVGTYASGINQQCMRVLDVGSYDVNGSYRQLFDDAKYSYSGLDMVSGPNVDIVLNHPYDWRELESDSFDIVVSGQTFEHTEFYWKTMEEMARVLKKGGLLCVIAPNGFHEHRYPVDCYRFFSDGMVAVARYVGLTVLHAHTNCAPTLRDRRWYSRSCADSMLVARKDFHGPPRAPEFDKYICDPPDQNALRGGLIPFPGGRDWLSRLQRMYIYTLKLKDKLSPHRR